MKTHLEHYIRHYMPSSQKREKFWCCEISAVKRELTKTSISFSALNLMEIVGKGIVPIKNYDNKRTFINYKGALQFIAHIMRMYL